MAYHSAAGKRGCRGYDKGVVMVKLGRDEPSYSMDPSGKLVYTRNTEVLTVDLQGDAENESPEGQHIPLSVRELSTTEIFATSLQDSPNRRFITMVGDGECIICFALVWRNKALGSGSSFAWAFDSNTYAVLEGRTRAHVCKNFLERSSPAMKGAGLWPVEGLHGGPLFGARGSGFVVFWVWESGEIVRRIGADANSGSRGQSHTCCSPNLAMVTLALAAEAMTA